MNMIKETILDQLDSESVSMFSKECPRRGRDKDRNRDRDGDRRPRDVDRNRDRDRDSAESFVPSVRSQNLEDKVDLSGEGIDLYGSEYITSEGIGG